MASPPRLLTKTFNPAQPKPPATLANFILFIYLLLLLFFFLVFEAKGWKTRGEREARATRDKRRAKNNACPLTIVRTVFQLPNVNAAIQLANCDHGGIS